MRKATLLLLTAVLFNTSFAQLTKGNWLVGGSANFSSTNLETIASSGTQKSTFINYSIAPNIGYFWKDKFAAGLKAGITKGKAEYGDLRQGGVVVAYGGYSNTTWFDLGPFMRYYFLEKEKPINLFAEANYLIGTANTQ